MAKPFGKVIVRIVIVLGCIVAGAVIGGMVGGRFDSGQELDGLQAVANGLFIGAGGGAVLGYIAVRTLASKEQ